MQSELSQVELQSKIDSLVAVNRIADAINRSLDMETVVEQAIEAITAYTGAPSVILFTVDKNSQTLEMLAGRGFSDGALAVGSRLPIDGSLSGQAVLRNTIITSNDIGSDNQVQAQVREALLKQELHTAVSIPLTFQDQVLGVINLIYESPPELTDLECDTLLSIGRAIGLAITNARYVAQMEREVVERKQAEQALQEQQAFLRQVLDLNPHFIFAKDREGRFTLANEALAEAYGTNTQELVGKRDADFNPNEEEAEHFHRDDLEVINKRKEKFILEEPITDTSGKIRWLQTVKRPLVDRDGEVSQLLGVATDITARKELEQEIQTMLERRSRQVQLVTQVAQEIATAANMSELYQRVVDLVKETFNYYHVQVLRYDPGLEVLTLVSGYGTVGQQMRADGHRMPLGAGLTGTAALTGQPVLQPDVQAALGWRSNPLLPETKGELAVPIKWREQVLGVLDIQSNRVGQLSEDDQFLLEGLCGQIATAIESTRLREEMEARLEELNTLQRMMSREGWQTYRSIGREESLGYWFDQSEVQPVTPGEVDVLNNGRQRTSVLAVRGAIIGTLGIEEDPERPLTLEEEALLDSVSRQVAEALEAARLFEQTQDALDQQERLTSELETVAQLSINASTVLEEELMLNSVVNLAQERFGFYHVHIYVVDEAAQSLVLRAGAGSIGRQMVADGHRIPLQADAIVSRAAHTYEGIIENDVSLATDFVMHPLLPDTRAEIAVPMLIGGDTLVGVLDVLSDRVGRFTEKDLLIQQTLASQVAVALQNAKLYAEQLATAERLREVDRLKSEFLASMSHELRTPLNSIIGFADVLLEGLDGKLNDRMEEDVSLIRESGRHLRELIGNILDMSKIEAGMMSLRYEQVNLRRMADEVMGTAGILAQEKQLRLEANIGHEVSTLYADRTRLMQVLLNLVSNAIKFTEVGSVTLSMRREQECVRVEVRDTGIDIRPEHLPIVFEQFRQVDGSLTRRMGGTGLGMPITKKLVELHGGEIGVRSRSGEGSTFWFTIPNHQEAPRQ